MKTRNKRIAIAIGFLICMAFAYSAFAFPTVYPTGTTIYKPDQSWNSYILVPRARHERPVVYLMDMNGNVVHEWKNIKASRTRLLPNGNLLTYSGATILEYDWDGNVVWKYAPPPGKPHHDLRRLPNGNTLVLTYVTVPKEYMKVVKDIESPWFGTLKRKKIKLRGDGILEVTPKGEIVWEWNAHEHLDLNKFSPICGLTDWTHGNTVFPLPENKWYDAGDKRFKPGNIMYNPRNLDEVYIIDKDTKEVVWRFNHNYNGGLAHCHHTEMIEKGTPGEGNILLFDNGMFARARAHAGQSYIIEANPVTKEIVWKYGTPKRDQNLEFSSKVMACQQRLPNGNTFIGETCTGRLFQVKPGGIWGGEIVWEYMVTNLPSNPLRSLGKDNPAHFAIGWANPYPYDYCPQLKVLPKPKELAVTPPDNKGWHLKPDKLRH